MASIDFQLPNIPIDQLRRHACLELACKWFSPDPSDTEVASSEIVKAAAVFAAFVKGSGEDAIEQPPKPTKAGAPKPIRAWVSRDKRDTEGFDIFVVRPPLKEVRGDGSEMFVSDDGGDMLASGIDMDFLDFYLDRGEVVEVEVEITIRKIG